MYLFIYACIFDKAKKIFNLFSILNFYHLRLFIFDNLFLLFTNGLDVVEEEVNDVDKLSALGNRCFFKDECEFFDIFISFP